MYKNILTLIFLMVFHYSIFSNPIDNTPITKVSELVFDDKDNWVMELSFPFEYDPFWTDSIIIKTPDGTAKLKAKYPKGTSLIVINSDSSSVPLKINRSGDKILLYTYSTRNSFKAVRKDSLIFGNYPGAFVGQPVNGYSICGLEGLLGYSNLKYCLTKRSSVGFLNDTTGSSAEMRGYLFDTDNKLVIGTQIKYGFQTYYELDTPLKISADGSYSTKIFRKFERDSISSLYGRYDLMQYWGTIEEIEPFVLKDIIAGTVIIQDIHLKSDLYVITSINEGKPLLPDNKVLVVNYPNPFNSTTNFYVDIPDRLKDKEAKINVYNISGQLISSISVKKGKTAFWDGKNMNGYTMASGVYYYKLIVDNQSLKSGSMILLK